MPVMFIHLKENAFSEERRTELLVKASELYAEILESPIDRVRIFINTYQSATLAVGGKVVTDDEPGAPFFEFIVMQGRPLKQRLRCMEEITRLIASTLEVDENTIRCACWPVPPEDWGIAGTPASLIREKEIADRKEA